MTKKSWNLSNLFANFLPKSKPTSQQSTGLEEGLRLAKLSANKQGPEWKAKAYQAYVEHARQHKYFTTEDVRHGAKNVSKPTDPRAWGHIAKASMKNGIMTEFEMMRSKSATTHGRYITVWRSSLVE